VKQASAYIVPRNKRHIPFFFITIERSIEFVIKVGAGTEAVGLFESIHLFVDKLMLQNAITVELNERPVCA
jgi:hypothetical protein